MDFDRVQSADDMRGPPFIRTHRETDLRDLIQSEPHGEQLLGGLFHGRVPPGRQTGPPAPPARTRVRLRDGVKRDGSKVGVFEEDGREITRQG